MPENFYDEPKHYQVSVRIDRPQTDPLDVIVNITALGVAATKNQIPSKEVAIILYDTFMKSVLTDIGRVRHCTMRWRSEAARPRLPRNLRIRYDFLNALLKNKGYTVRGGGGGSSMNFESGREQENTRQASENQG